MYWDRTHEEEVASERVDVFLDEIAALYRRHGLSIAHEDAHGALIVRPFQKADEAWLRAANIENV